MEVDFAFLADSAESVMGKLYVMGGAVDTLSAPAAPIIHPRLSFALRLVASAAEMGRSHKLEIHVMDEDGKKVASVGGPFDANKNPGLPLGWRQGSLMVVNFVNLRFENFGNYTFEILINNSSLKSVPLRIVKVQQGEN